MVLLGVQHAEDHNAWTDDLIEYFIGKPAEHDSPKTPIIQARLFGIMRQLTQRAANLVQKLQPQPRPPLFIPIPGRRQISLCGGAEQQQPAQGGGRRNRASTSDQGVTAPGLVS